MINRLQCFFLILAIPAFGQQSAILDKYVAEGLANNLSLKQESLEISKAAEAIRQAKALFYPQATFAPTYSYAAGGRRLDFPVGDLLNPAYKTLNELTGKNQFPTNIENVNVLLAPTNFHDTKVTVSYSIYNPEIKYNYLIQKSLLSAQEAKRKVLENEIRYAIETAYFQYLQSLEASRILVVNAGTLNELVRLNKKLVANNTLTKDAVLSSEFEVTKVEMQQTAFTKNTKVAAAYFNFLLNRALEEPIEADTTLGSRTMIDYDKMMTLAELQSQARSNRSELKQLEWSIDAASTVVKMHKMAAMRPSLFIGSNVGFQGFGYTFRDQAYVAGQVGLQWNLFKGFERKSKIRQAGFQTELLKTKQTEVEKQIDLQTTQAFYDLTATREAQRAAESGVTKASQYFRVIDSKYRNGSVLMIEYIKAQNDAMSAQIQESVTRYDVLIKKALLNKITAEP